MLPGGGGGGGLCWAIMLSTSAQYNFFILIFQAENAQLQLAKGELLTQQTELATAYQKLKMEAEKIVAAMISSSSELEEVNKKVALVEVGATGFPFSS